MKGGLALVAKPGLVHRPTGVICPVCTQFFGFDFRPMVTIQPTHCLVLSSGSLVIDNPVIVCAQCRERGVETIL